MLTKIKTWIKRLFRHHSAFTPLITISISKSALIHNLHEFQCLTPLGQVAPVLKSNAYGHGLALVANILKDENVPFFIIDSYFEAMSLRNEGVKTPLLIIGYSPTEVLLKNNLKNVHFTITSLDALRELALKVKENNSREIPIHLKIDTGMHRQGLFPEELSEAFDVIKKTENLSLEGIASHFADADGRDIKYTETQILKWNKVVKYSRSQFPTLKYWHVSATAGHAFVQADANLTRLGIGLYGLTQVGSLKITPALEMKTVISGIKKIKKGDCIGYGCTFTADKDMTIATIPAGYFEGIDRGLSNIGQMKIGQIFAPIVGRVSMNITCIDISKIPNAKRGDEVVIISNKKEDTNSAENIAKEIGTIPYEIPIYIPAHLKRIVVK